MIWRPTRRLLRSKATIAFAVIVLLLGLAILIGEVIVRSNPELMPVKMQIRSFVNNGEFHPIPEPDIGFLGPPHVRTWISTADYEHLEETDAYGFPNRMPLPQTAEIVLLGDSLTGGAGVGIDGQFSTLVGESLPNSRVANLGTGGAAPNRQFRIFRKFGASFQPRLVISCIYLAADLDGQIVFDSWLKDGAKEDYNEYRIELNDRLHPKSFWTRVQRKSYLAGKLTELVLRWWGIPDRASFAYGPDVLLDIDSLRARTAGLDRQDPRMLSIVDSLKEMRALAQNAATDFLVVLIPSKEEIYGAFFMPEVFKSAQILEQRLREEGFSVLSVYDAIRDKAKNQSAFFPHDIHLNALGNQIVADALVNWIKQTGALVKNFSRRGGYNSIAKDSPATVQFQPNTRAINCSPVQPCSSRQ